MKKYITNEHVHEHRCWSRVGRHARIVAGVGERCIGDEQLAGEAAIAFLCLQADAAALRVEVDGHGAVEPVDGRRRLHVHRARQRDRAASLHMHVLRTPDARLCV